VPDETNLARNKNLDHNRPDQLGNVAESSTASIYHTYFTHITKLIIDRNG
jgi:hypothetical protein